MGDFGKDKAIRDLIDAYSDDYCDLIQQIKKAEECLPPVVKYIPGDIVMSKETGKTGTVEAVWFDADLYDHQVILSNADGHRQSDLVLICSSL